MRELTEPDEVHLAHMLLTWSESVPGTVRIAEAPLRTRVKLAGEVKAITVRSDTPWPEFEAELWDGTGTVRVVWLGRDAIPGVVPGARLIVEGVIGETNGEHRMIDPTFEIIAPGPL
jgi:hypothetical protein